MKLIKASNTSIKHIWSWLNRSLVQDVFTDPICGDGTCDVPQEFEQWESYGCAEDCGSVPRSEMTNLFVEVTAHFESDAELREASWNLCSQTHDLCFYPTSRRFAAKNETQVVEMWLPDGVWEIAVVARNGGVSGRVYTENSTTLTYYRNITETSVPAVSPINNATSDNGNSTNTTTLLNFTNPGPFRFWNSTNATVSFNLTNVTRNTTIEANSTNVTIPLNATNFTRIRRLDERRQLAGVNSSNATSTNETSGLNTTNGPDSVARNSSNATRANSTSVTDGSPQNATNRTNTSFGWPPTSYNDTFLPGNRTDSNATIFPDEIATDNSNGTNGEAANNSNSTTPGTEMIHSGANSTNSTSGLVLVTEVVKIQTDILSWSLCKDETDSSVDHIFEHINRTVLPRCQRAGVVHQLCGKGDQCHRCLSEVDCLAQSCGWDPQGVQCYNRICSDSALQCRECIDQSSCEAVGCLFDTTVGCLYGCDDCSNCTEQACGLKDGCYWDASSTECEDVQCDQFNCSLCDEGFCNSLHGWCRWNSSLAMCEQLYCETNHCDRPMCLEQGACESTLGCRWDASTSLCLENACNQSDCSNCDQDSCTSLPGWCQWNNSLEACAKLQCAPNHCDRPRCNEQGVCDSTVGCNWDSAASACLEIDWCTQSNCSLCDESGCNTLPGWCQWNSSLVMCEQLYCETNHCDRPRCNDQGVCDSTVGCNWDNATSACLEIDWCTQSSCSLCDESGCNTLPGWCQWNSSLAICEQLYCETNHCDRPMCIEPGACDSTVGCRWNSAASACLEIGCNQYNCSFCDENGCNVFPGWCQWDSGLGICAQLYCDINHCDRLMCYEPGECENTFGCTWDASSSTCFKSQVFLPLAETIVNIDLSALAGVQVDANFLSNLDVALLQEYEDDHSVIRNNADEVQVVSTFQMVDTAVITLSPNSGTTFTSTDLQDFAVAFRNARCGGMPEEFCKLENVNVMRRRQLSDQDLEVAVGVYISAEFFVEEDKLSLTNRPLPTTSTGFSIRLVSGTTSFPGSFATPVMSYDITMTVLTNLDEASTSSSLLSKLSAATAKSNIFEAALIAETGFSSPIVGTVDVDLCIRRDCSGHGTCSNGVCSCSSGWSGTHCIYFGGQVVSQTTSNPTASAITAQALPFTHVSGSTRSPSPMHPGREEALSQFSSDISIETPKRAGPETVDPTPFSVLQMKRKVEVEQGDPVATVWMDIKAAILEEAEVKAKVSIGIWEVLLKDNAIRNNRGAVAVLVDIEQTRTYTLNTPSAFAETLHGEDLLIGVRKATCGGTSQTYCDVYYPNHGVQQVVVNISYDHEDFAEPPMYPDQKGFSDRLKSKLQGATSKAPLSGYSFTEESVTPLATVQFFVVNESASISFMKRVQAAAESHADIVAEVKNVLGWAGPLLRSTGALYTDLCNNRLCSGKGYCSDGQCTCKNGFFGLSCSLSTNRRLDSTCSAELECVFCYDALDCDALPLCMYDWTEGLCVDETSMGGEKKIPYTATCVADSSGNCEQSFIGNGLCDSVCNIPSCGYDGGDCPDTANLLGYVCSDFCYCNMLNDQVCNRECNNALCGFDLGDCCVKTFTKKLTRQFELWTSSTPETVKRLTPDPAVPRLRYLATTNRLIAGILLNQKRRSLKNCTDLRFPNLSKSGCFDGTFSQEPYGADPGKQQNSSYQIVEYRLKKCVVFLRGTSLSDEALNKYAYYDANDPNEVSSLGVPYGFHHVTIEGFEDDAGFPLFYDVNFGYEKGQDILKYGKEGFYLDDQTSLLTIQAVTYNPHYKLFASIDINLEFETGGRIRMRYDIQSIRVDMYSTARDHRRLLAELTFLGATIFDVLLKLHKLLRWRSKGRTVRSYFVSIWNYIDLLNILLMVYLALTWIDFQTKEFAVYNPKERFDVYSNINADARFLEFNEAELQQMLRFFADTKALSNLISTYVTGSACALVLLILRLLEVLDFQERMGIVTRTITNAVIDLLHWLILFGLIFFLYVYMGFLIFGTAILSFSTIERSFQTCFGILLGEIGVTEEMFNLPNKASVYIFYYTFIMIVFFVLINVFLAIIVDAYVDVKNKAENSESLPKEVVVLTKSLIKSLPCFRIGGQRYVNDSEIIRILDEWLDEERTLTATPGMEMHFCDDCCLD